MLEMLEMYSYFLQILCINWAELLMHQRDSERYDRKFWNLQIFIEQLLSRSVSFTWGKTKETVLVWTESQNSGGHETQILHCWHVEWIFSLFVHFTIDD